MGKIKEDIKCKYIFKEDYNPLYVNGAQGGINSLGEIVINYYLERTALPNSQTFSINEGKMDNKPNQEEPIDLQNSFVRVVQNGVIMNYQTAKEIHRWLGEHISALEEITKKHENKGKK